ncbi:MAG: glycosyltransferase family 39 protein [Planctomycetota bacterium]|jgi:4-amino-4-deoxy-L-arabinose transferase-like glycosyltransferase
MINQEKPNQILSDKASFWSCGKVILLCILLLAGFLRLVNLGQSPPGLNQDEAANAWNAYCLLKTGKDQVGISWPIFYMRGLGGSLSTLHVYLLLPFQAIGGLNIITTRLPAVIGGVFTVLLIYFVGRRLFDQKVAIVAAGLLALNPWHLQQSRWGHGADLCALFGIAPLAMLLWANMPLCKDKTRAPRPILAGLAGAVTGICCYSYPAVRLFVPAFLLAAGLVTLPAWWNQLKTRKGALAIAAFVVAFALTFGPLAWRHVFHSEGVARQREALFLWTNSDQASIVLNKVANRYIQHFGLDFLFVNGDHYQIQSPPDMGQFHWYMYPLMVLGFITLARKAKLSYSARILLVYILVYPIGDIFFRHISLHALRSSPGLCSLVLLSAVGVVSTATWLWKQSHVLLFAVIAAFMLLVIGLNARYLSRFYGEYNRRPAIYHGFHVDLIEACRWLRPRFDNVEAVFCTTQGMNQPYIITLVALGYDPERATFSTRR